MSYRYDFEIDTKFYPLDAVYSVALLEKQYLKLKSSGKNSVTMTISTEKSLSKSEIDDIMRRIEQELINQTLRLKIAKENQKLREYILGKALLGAQFGVVDKEPEIETSEPDFVDDPLGIATPWEEKNRVEKKSTNKKDSKKKKKSLRKK